MTQARLAKSIPSSRSDFCQPSRRRSGHAAQSRARVPVLGSGCPAGVLLLWPGGKTTCLPYLPLIKHYKCAQLIPSPLLPAGLGSGLLQFPHLQLKGSAFPLHASLTPHINSFPLPAHKVHTLLLNQLYSILL